MARICELAPDAKVFSRFHSRCCFGSSGTTWQEVDDPLPLEHEKFLKHKFLVQEILFARCIDKDPMVHSKAVSSFAHGLESSVTSPLDSMQAFLDNTPAVSGVQSCQKSAQKNSTEEDFMMMLRNTVSDEKTNVRKSAVQVLVNILKHCAILCMRDKLPVLHNQCFGITMSVNNQALRSLLRC